MNEAGQDLGALPLGRQMTGAVPPLEPNQSRSRGGMTLQMRTFYASRLKRPGDLVLVLLASVVWVPLLMALAATVRLRLGPPVFFRQSRPGLHGRPFTILKLRTMTDARGPSGTLLSDADRLTPFGRWLRSTSLDELPELLNVLRGDMSLVGPRPLLMQYLGRYSADQARRHLARPGVTGWAQINGRNTTTWEERLQLDTWYVDHLGWVLDMKILFTTLSIVVRRKGISADGHATMPEFMGTDGRDRR